MLRLFGKILILTILNLSAVNCDKKLDNVNSGKLVEPIVESDLSADYNERLKHSSLIYGIITFAEEAKLNQQCYDEIMQIFHGFDRKDVWTMKILDSSGQVGSNFMLGNNHWIGSTKACGSVNAPLYITLSDRYERSMKPNLIQDTSPFEVEYRIAYAKHHSPWQIEIKLMTENILHMGLCLPKSCTNAEIHNMTQNYLNSKTFDMQNLFEFKGEVLLVKDLKLRENFLYKRSVVLASFLVLIVLLIVLCAWNRNQKLGITSETSECSSTWDKVLTCFSIQNNWKSLMDDSCSKESFCVINGIKSILCFLVLTNHIFWYSIYATSNLGILHHLHETARFQPVVNIALLFECFFAISGFLMAYNFLKNEKQITEIKANDFIGNTKLFLKLLIHRYLRLTPVYFMVGLFSEISSSILTDTSKFWAHDRCDLNCERNWWRNLLYINNFNDVDEMCMTWTWSMACEMQFYIVFLILLFIYVKKHSLGIKIFSTLTVSAAAICFTINIKYGIIFNIDVLWENVNVFYTRPWMRILPYCVGVGFGWYLKTYKKTFFLTERQRKYSLSLATLVLTIFLFAISIHRVKSPFISSLGQVLIAKTLIPFATGWFIITNACGYNNIVSKFLSSRIFVRVGKLSYVIYLLNGAISALLFGEFENGGTIDTTLYGVLIIGIFFITYWTAVVFALLFELPFYKLSTEILKGTTPVQKKTN